MKHSAVMAAVIAVVAIIVLIILFVQRSDDRAAPAEEPGATAGLGEEIFKETTPNPVAEELPKTNPFGAETNPFRDAYANPFGE